MNSDNLIDDKMLRDKLSSRINVLKKTKNILDRGDKTPYIQYIKVSEWKQVMSTFTAMCRKYGTIVEKMIKEPPNIKFCINP